MSFPATATSRTAPLSMPKTIASSRLPRGRARQRGVSKTGGEEARPRANPQPAIPQAQRARAVRSGAGEESGGEAVRITTDEVQHGALLANEAEMFFQKLRLVHQI